LNNQQITINNSPYIYYKETNRNLIIDTLSFKAPSEKGDYYINAFLISKPFSETRPKLSTSKTIKLTVE